MTRRDRFRYPTIYDAGMRHRRSDKKIQYVAACLLVGGALSLTACQSTSAPTPAPSVFPSGRAGITAVFDEIYDAGYERNNADAPFDKIDIVYVAFGHIDPETLTFGFEKKVGSAVEQRRLDDLKARTASLRGAGKLKLVMSLGYGDAEVGANGKPLIEQNPKLTAKSVADFLDRQGLDGFDIDYETPTFSSVGAFKTVAAELRKAIGPNRLLTISPNQGTNLDGQTLNETFDFVNVQSYTQTGGRPCGNNAQVDWAEFLGPDGLNVQPSKLTAGQDTDAGCPISVAIDTYSRNKLGGVFAWQLRPGFKATADDMYSATRR